MWSYARGAPSRIHSVLHSIPCSVPGLSGYMASTTPPAKADTPIKGLAVIIAAAPGLPAIAIPDLRGHGGDLCIVTTISDHYRSCTGRMLPAC